MKTQLTQPNGKIRKVGDKVGGFQIVQISDTDRILWEGDGKQGKRWIVDRCGGKQGGLTRCHEKPFTKKEEALKALGQGAALPKPQAAAPVAAGSKS